jgi:hypothetical protein
MTKQTPINIALGAASGTLVNADVLWTHVLCATIGTPLTWHDQGAVVKIKPSPASPLMTASGILPMTTSGIWMQTGNDALPITIALMDSALSTVPWTNWLTHSKWKGEQSASNTSTISNEAAIEAKIASLFADAELEEFDDESTAEFSKNIELAVRGFGSHALQAIMQNIVCELASPEVCREALLAISWSARDATFPKRRQLLEQSLRCSSKIVRDAAGVAIAAMNDPRSASAITRAIQREKSPLIRRNLELVFTQLEESRKCHS